VLSYLITLLSSLGYMALNGQMSVTDKMERMRKTQHQSLPEWNEGNYKKKNFRIATIQSIFELEPFQIRSQAVNLLTTMFNSCLASLTDGCIILLQKVLFLQLSTYVNGTKFSFHNTFKSKPYTYLAHGRKYSLPPLLPKKFQNDLLPMVIFHLL